MGKEGQGPAEVQEVHATWGVEAPRRDGIGRGVGSDRFEVGRMDGTLAEHWRVGK